MRFIFYFFIALSLPTNIVIAGTQTGNITNINIRANDGLIYFYMNGELKNKPTCATKNYWMIRDENSNTGKQQYSLLLSAFASQTKITVEGMNSCIRWKDGEDVNLIRTYK